jgi:hypothetical protein
VLNNQKRRFPARAVMAGHLLVLRSVARGEFVDAFDHQDELVTSFHHAMDDHEFTWSQSVMIALYVDLRRLALKADVSLRAKGDIGRLRSGMAADKLRQGFSKVSNDKSPLQISKKWAAIHVINQIFKLLFSINQLSVGLTNLQRWVETPLCPNHEEKLEHRGFPISQIVTYKYYSGRLALFEDKYAGPGPTGMVKRP